MAGADRIDRSDVSARREQLDEILAELMRASDGGETVDRDEWLARYPDFAAELQEYFDRHAHAEEWFSPFREVAAHALHVRCPHCHNPIELLEDAKLDEVSCPSCGSSFSLVGEKTISHYSAGEKTIGHFQLLDRVGIPRRHVERVDGRQATDAARSGRAVHQDRQGVASRPRSRRDPSRPKAWQYHDGH